jgi:nitrite reductase [NAD(P)H] small subunit
MMPASAVRPGTRIAHISEIPEGEGRTVEVAGLHLAVFNTRHGVFATQPDCPHRQGPLADGLTGTGRITCPLHDWVFDLETGAGINTECRIATYPVAVGEDGTIRLGAEAAELIQA